MVARPTREANVPRMVENGDDRTSIVSCAVSTLIAMAQTARNAKTIIPLPRSKTRKEAQSTFLSVGWVGVARTMLNVKTSPTATHRVATDGVGGTQTHQHVNSIMVKKTQMLNQLTMSPVSQDPTKTSSKPPLILQLPIIAFLSVSMEETTTPMHQLPKSATPMEMSCFLRQLIPLFWPALSLNVARNLLKCNCHWSLLVASACSE